MGLYDSLGCTWREVEKSEMAGQCERRRFGGQKRGTWAWWVGRACKQWEEGPAAPRDSWDWISSSGRCGPSEKSRVRQRRWIRWAVAAEQAPAAGKSHRAA